MANYDFSPVTGPNGDGTTGAGAINDAGEVVGYYVTSTDQGSTTQAFSETAGVYTTITVPFSQAAYTTAAAVSNTGEIVGGYEYFDTTMNHYVFQGFVDQNGSFTSVNYPSSSGGRQDTFLTGVNSAGDIVGYTYDKNYNSQSFLLKNGSFIAIAVPNASSTAVNGINDAGELYGQYQDSSGSHGFVDNGGVITEIQVPGASSTEVTGVNAKGVIAGEYTVGGSNQSYGFVDDNGTISTFDYPGAYNTFTGGINDAGQIAGTQLPNANSPIGQTGFVASPVCFASGTHLRTERGEVAVDHLTTGDLVLTASGELRAIRWLGHRTIDCRRHPRSMDVMPVRIEAHAFGANRPVRDLFVSPGHSICVDLLGEVLVPSCALVNGSTVAQVKVDTVTYWHVELHSHDIVLAENLAAESYLDMGNRSFFAEAEAVALHAAPDTKRTNADLCRPVYDRGPIVEAIRRRLAARAAQFKATNDEKAVAC